MLDGDGLMCYVVLTFELFFRAYNPLEFRHSPMSMADERALVIGLIGEMHAQAERAVLAEAKTFGAQAVAIGERQAPEMHDLDGAFALESGLPEHAQFCICRRCS